MKDNTSLARLTEEGLKIQAAMDYAEENNCDCDFETLKKQLNTIEGQWFTKIENIGHLIQDMNSDDKAMEAEINRLKARRETKKRSLEFLKDYAMGCMVQMNELKLKFPLITVYVATNPPSVEVTDETQIPKEFNRLIPERYEPDKIKIIDNFKKTGEIPPGCNVIVDRKRLVVK